MHQYKTYIIGLTDYIKQHKNVIDYNSPVVGIFSIVKNNSNYGNTININFDNNIKTLFMANEFDAFHEVLFPDKKSKLFLNLHGVYKSPINVDSYFTDILKKLDYYKYTEGNKVIAFNNSRKISDDRWLLDINIIMYDRVVHKIKEMKEIIEEFKYKYNIKEVNLFIYKHYSLFRCPFAPACTKYIKDSPDRMMTLLYHGYTNGKQINNSSHRDNVYNGMIQYFHNNHNNHTDLFY